MGIFVTQGNYTEDALRGMVDTPEDRSQAVANLLESVGAKLIAYYITTGEYDFMAISESDSLTDLVAAAMVAGSTGGVTNLKTFQAMSTQEAKAAMEKANGARGKFRPAGGAG